MRTVDTHHHFLPPKYMQEIGDDEIARMLVSGRAPMWTPSASIEAMDRHGIGLAVLSLSAPAVAPVRAGRRPSLARECNEYAARMGRDYPGRFRSFGTLPLPDIDASLLELTYCLDELTADGVCLLTNHGGKYLGDEHFAPLFEEIDRRSIVVFVHPTNPPLSPLPDLPSATFEFPFETTRAVASLLFSGALSKYANIKFIFSHAGGTVPFLAERLARLESREHLREKVTRGVMNELRALNYDTALSVNPFALGGLLRLVSPDQVVFGSDYPHAGEATMANSVKALSCFGLQQGLFDNISRHNAIRLLDRQGVKEQTNVHALSATKRVKT